MWRDKVFYLADGVLDYEEDEEELLTLNSRRRRKLREDVDEVVENYWDVSIFSSVLQRLPFLLILLLMQSMSSIILQLFSALLKRHDIIFFFITMLTGTGGNAGGQALATIIQGLASGHIRLSDWPQLLVKELAISVFLSLTVGVLGFLRVFFTPNSTYVDCVAVASSLASIVIISIVVGTTLPLAMKAVLQALMRAVRGLNSPTLMNLLRFLDPINTAFPLFQVMMDIIGTIVTCLIGTVVYAALATAALPDLESAADSIDANGSENIG
mmetsp:Transcript_21938/g.55105  ORF Transcript_21938/g.55105 Transcript_21938/m.55105 type:complete len:270 (-) Transcript_21938:23-832(-)